MKTGFNANCFVPILDVFSWSKKTRGKVDHSDLIRTNNLYHNIKSNNFVIRGDRDGDVFFFSKGVKVNPRQRKVAEQKIQVSSQFCLHLTYTKNVK